MPLSCSGHSDDDDDDEQTSLCSESVAPPLQQGQPKMPWLHTYKGVMVKF